MIQMMNHYDYTPDKINTDIIQQAYDDNTTLDEFITNMSNDINSASPSNKDSPKNKDYDDNPRPKAYGLFPMPEPRKAESNKYNKIGNDIKEGKVSREGVEAPRKVSAAPSPPVSAPAAVSSSIQAVSSSIQTVSSSIQPVSSSIQPVSSQYPAVSSSIQPVSSSIQQYPASICNVLNVVDTLHDVWHDVCADSGATEDVLNSRCGIEATNIKQVDDIILMGMGGEVVIDQVGDYKFKNELKSEGALINNSCNMSCLSVPSRCSQGWSFWAKDDKAQFISPTDNGYDFTLQDGLYKLNKDQHAEDPDVTYMREAWMNKAKKKVYNKGSNVNMNVWMMVLMLDRTV